MRRKLLCLLLSGIAWAGPRKPYAFHPNGLPGTISNATVKPLGNTNPLPPHFVSPDINIKLMAAWSLRHLNKNPRPELNYEPVFFIRPMSVPPAPEGHDPIVTGDTDARMDWEYPNMREILGLTNPGEVERKLHARVLAYLHPDGLAWSRPATSWKAMFIKVSRWGPPKLPALGRPPKFSAASPSATSSVKTKTNAARLAPSLSLSANSLPEEKTRNGIVSTLSG